MHTRETNYFNKSWVFLYSILVTSRITCQGYISRKFEYSTCSSIMLYYHKRIKSVILLHNVFFTNISRNNMKQECIPVRCVPSAAMTIPRGVSGRGVVCLAGKTSACQGVSACQRRLSACQNPLPVDRMTDTCKNITLQQLRCGR